MRAFEWLLDAMPLACAFRVRENGLWLASELDKVVQNPVTCKTNYLSAAGFLYSHRRGEIVSRKKGGSSNGGESAPNSGQKGDVIRWVNVHIPDELVEQVASLASDTAGLCVQFMAYTADGADILVKRKRGNGDWLAMLTFDDPYIAGGKCALTGWSNNPVDAVAAVVAKFELVLGGEVPEPPIHGSNVGKRFG